MSKEQNNFSSFVIVGLSLIGGSIAKDLRTKYPGASIVSIDSDKQSIDDAMQLGIVDKGIDYADLPRFAQVVVLTPPVGQVIPCARRVFDSLNKSKNRAFERCVVFDAASVKKPIAAEFKKLTAKSHGVEFLATHPMAGTEFSGFSHARKDLFRAKPWMVCRHSENSEEAVSGVCELLRGLGSRVVFIDPDEHDKSAAVVSHAVIILSNIIFDYIASVHPEALKLAGDGFTSTTRIASGNPELHKDIILHNSEHTDAVLKEFSQFLDDKIASLSVSDAKLLQEYFTQNMNRRNEWIRRKE